MMRKSTLNFVVDFLTLLAIFAMIATGLIIRFVLPPGTGGQHGTGGLALWGLGRHDWGDVHFWASVILGVLLIVHVALHWTWVCTMVHQLLRGTNAARLEAGKRNAYGIGFLAAVVLIFSAFTWYADRAVKRVGGSEQAASRPRQLEDDGRRHGHREEHQAAHELVRGSMTLAEVEAATGVSVETLRTELGLPASVSAEERLGRLGREFGFSMDRVREIVARHMSHEIRRGLGTEPPVAAL